MKRNYSYIANEGLSFYFKTNLNAPKYRVIRIDFQEDAGSMSREELDAAVAASMTEIVAETSDVLESAICTNGDVLLLCYLQDCKNVLVVSELQSGKVRGSIPLPGVGSVTGSRVDMR